MRTIVMNMSTGRFERIEDAEVEYGEAVLNAIWNPELTVAQRVPEQKKEWMPAEMATMDVELFLQSMDNRQR